MIPVFPPPPRDPLGGQSVVQPWMKWFTAIQTATNVNTSFTDLRFILQVADSLAPNAQALGALVTGYLKNTTGTGVLSVQAVPIPVADGGTHLVSGTSGGILGYTATGVLASSVLLTNHAIVLGRGAGATPVPLASLGTATTVLHGAAAGDPTFSSVNRAADVSGLLPGANGGTGVANTGKTITIGGSVTFSGAFTFTGTLTGNTAVTFPTSGTLLTSASAVTSITGTANQVIASAATGAVTLSTPQNIGTGNSPTFAGLTLSGLGLGTVHSSVGGVLSSIAKSSAYTPTNVTTDRSYDANATTIDELADVIGTLVQDLQTAGVLG